MIGFNGGLIGKNNPTVAGTSIPGVWTSREQEVAVRRQQWSGVADPSYSSVSLLLHGDGANGSITFTDNSPSPKIVTGVGNAQISTLQSKFGGASILLDGTGDYLTSTANAGFNLGGGDYTVELWCRLTSASNDGGLISKAPPGGGNINDSVWALRFPAGGSALSLYMMQNFRITGTRSIRTSGNWHHVALCRSGSDTRLFVDGTQDGSTYVSNYTIADGGSIFIGADFFSQNNVVNGYIDDVRITKGVARYTAAFPVPTAPFPNF